MARLMVQACFQKYNVDNQAVYVPILRRSTLRLLLALSGQHRISLGKISFCSVTTICPQLLNIIRTDLENVKENSDASCAPEDDHNVRGLEVFIFHSTIFDYFRVSFESSKSSFVRDPKLICFDHEKTMNDKERKIFYKEHRRRVQNAKSVVDSQAPKPKQSEEHRELTFFDLMKALYNRGNQRTFTSSPVHVRSNTNVVGKLRCLSSRRITQTDREKSNLSLMVNFSSHTNEKNSKKDKIDNHANRKRNAFAIPPHVLQRYNHLHFLDTSLLRKLLRPKIFLDLEIREERPVGRLVIQLFTEACPEIVMQFVRICTMRHATRFHFTRLFPPLWLEGELLLDDTNALTIPNIEHDPNAINHGSAAGILSFPSRYLRGSKYRFISFTPVDVLNGKRIAFGRIRRGQNVLEALQGFDVTRNGRPVKDVVVSSCGVL
uniref:PPIase cyclophilin-type domain-containing protein n=1 Tax=Glossina brevipalpis TaxID=37001 RepID=A0A1A9WXJ1_9MUSC